MATLREFAEHRDWLLDHDLRLTAIERWIARAQGFGAAVTLMIGAPLVLYVIEHIQGK